MSVLTPEQLKHLGEVDQKVLRAFGRTSFSKKSNLAISSLLTPAQVDSAIKNLASIGLVKVKPSRNLKGDARVYLTGKGGQVKRQIGLNLVKFPHPVDPDIDDKLKRQIAELKESKHDSK